MVLLCLHSFLADPMLRLLCLTFACLAILLHHLYKRPFRDPIANACETFSLIALVIISTFSLAEASLVSEGTEIGGPRENVFKVLQWIELALLGVVPACLFMLVSLVVLSQLFRLFLHVLMWDQRQPQRLNRVWHFPVDSSRPLLYSSPAMYWMLVHSKHIYASNYLEYYELWDSKSYRVSVGCTISHCKRKKQMRLRLLWARNFHDIRTA